MNNRRKGGAGAVVVGREEKEVELRGGVWERRATRVAKDCDREDGKRALNQGIGDRLYAFLFFVFLYAHN